MVCTVFVSFVPHVNISSFFYVITKFDSQFYWVAAAFFELKPLPTAKGEKREKKEKEKHLSLMKDNNTSGFN